MNLKQQVVSLELSKKLDELGVKAESHFYWFPKIALRSEKPAGDGIVDTEVIAVEDDWYVSCDPAEEMRIHYPAYSVAELGEMLKEYRSGLYWWDSGWNGNEWRCSWIGTDIDGIESSRRNYFADTEADARAKMLIYLLENSIIEAPK